jgi:hypothetical protein
MWGPGAMISLIQKQNIILKMPIKKEQVVVIEFLSFMETFHQGIGLSIDKRQGDIQVFEVDNEKIKHPVFWTDTAPRIVKIKCFPKKQDGYLHIWNIWRHSDDGGADAWIGNAGLYEELQEDGSLLFHCSNGVGDVDFNDLIFKVTLL